MSNLRSLGRVLVGVACAMGWALFSSCGSNDSRPLILIDVVPGQAGDATGIKVEVAVGNAPIAHQGYPLSGAATEKLGIYLPSGTNGSATIVVSLVDGSGCVLATGSVAAVAFKAGETTSAGTVKLTAAGPCPASGVDSGTSPTPDAGADQAGRTDAADAPTDAGTPAVDAATPAEDVRPAGGDTAPDVASPSLDAGAEADTASPGADAPSDPKPSTDQPVINPDLGPDLSPDLGPDSPADGPTTLNVLAKCTKYTHSIINGDAGAEDWGIRRLAFTPDGKYLVSFGEDGRAKVWAVGATALTDTGIVFPGERNLWGAISRDGKYVAVADGQSSMVKVYDLAATVQFGAPSLKWSMPSDSLPSQTFRILLAQFTSDGGHLVIGYRGYNNTDPNLVAVWDLSTQQTVRVAKFEHADLPFAVLGGDYAGAMWIASANKATTDAGATLTTVTLVDIAQTTPAKAQVSIADEVDDMAFAPDGTSLAIAFDSGEVSVWDITNKATISRLGSPLVPGSSSSSISAYSVAYTDDGKYVAAGRGDVFGGSEVDVTLLQQRTSLQKDIDYLPWSVAFAPNGLALAVGERDLGIVLYCHP